MLKKILVPIDGSFTSLQALKYALQLGQSFNSKIVILHVTDPYDLSPLIDLTTITIPTKEQSAAEKKRAGEIALAIAQKITDQASYKDVAFEKAIDSNPAERIIEHAQEINADAVIMGNRGLGTAKAFFLGSVSAKVVTAAPCPVFIVK